MPTGVTETFGDWRVVYSRALEQWMVAHWKSGLRLRARDRAEALAWAIEFDRSRATPEEAATVLRPETGE